MGYLLLAGIGAVILAIGIFSHWLIMRSAKEYAAAAPTETGKAARDRTMGLALCHSWIAIALGAALLLFTAYCFIVNR